MIPSAKFTISLRPPSTLAALAALALAVGATQGGTVFNHSFGGDDIDPLNGVTPDTTTGSATWVASSNINADGTIAARANNGSDSAWLAFTPQSGFVYTLTAVMGQTTDGSNPLTQPTINGSWMALGFSADNVTDSFFGDPNNTSPWALHRAPGSTGANQVVSHAGPGATVSENHATVSATITLSVVLDTTEAQWKATWFEGSNQLREHTYAVGENPTINYVGFGRSNMSVGPIESFSLTDTTVVDAGAPQLSGFTYDPSTGACAVNLKGTPGATYKLVEAADLDFGNPDQNPVPLTEVTLGTPVGSLPAATGVITDGNGDATVEFNLGTGKDKSFVRAEEMAP